MSIVKNIARKEIIINDNEVIIEEEKSEDGYEWKDVVFKSGNEEYNIGSYFTYNYLLSTEWIEYNSDYIVLMSIYILTFDGKTSEPQVMELFDIKSKAFVTGSKEKLKEIYNNSFKKNKRHTKKLTMN